MLQKCNNKNELFAYAINEHSKRLTFDLLEWAARVGLMRLSGGGTGVKLLVVRSEMINFAC